MIEIILLNYLQETLNVPVFTEEQTEHYDSYVVIEKTASAVKNYIQSATIAIQSYAKSLYEASKLNEEVKKAMQDIVLLESISKSKLNSDYNYTDTTKKKYRYQAVYDLVFFD